MNAKLNTEAPQSFISNDSNTSFSAEDILLKHSNMQKTMNLILVVVYHLLMHGSSYNKEKLF